MNEKHLKVKLRTSLFQKIQHVYTHTFILFYLRLCYENFHYVNKQPVDFKLGFRTVPEGKEGDGGCCNHSSWYKGSVLSGAENSPVLKDTQLSTIVSIPKLTWKSWKVTEGRNKVMEHLQNCQCQARRWCKRLVAWTVLKDLPERF